LLAATAVFSGQAAAPVRVADAPARDDAFTFEIDAPLVSVVPGSDGFAEVRAEGYDGKETLAGRPDLPRKVVLLALPPGATPRLIVRRLGETGRRASRPRPVPRAVPARTEVPDGFESVEDAARRLSEAPEAPAIYVTEAEPSIYGAAETWPAEPVWLGREGVLRDQRYVEVHLAPVRFDAASASLVVEPALEVTVEFEGAGPAGAEAEASRFEPVYRQAFVNYAQGRRFRLGRDDARSDSGAPRTPASVRSSIGPMRRIAVRQDGVVRLDHAYFLANAPEFLTHDPAQWRLTGQGSAVALHVQQSGGNPALLEPGEWVQFYGQKFDDDPEDVLHWQGEIDQEWLYEIRDFTDDQIYFLTVDSSPQAPMATRAAAPTGATPEATHTALARFESDDQFWPIAGESWFALPPLTEAAPLQIKSLALTGLAGGTLPLHVRVRLRGVSACDAVDPDHETRVSLRNATNQTLVLPAGPGNIGNQNVGQFDGAMLFAHEFDWVHAGADPQASNPLQVAVQASLISGCGNDLYLDYAEVEYQRTFTAQGDALTFDWPDGDAEFEIAGMTDPAPQIYEATELLPGTTLRKAVRLTGATLSPTVRFHMSNDPALADGTPRRFVVVGGGGVAVPALGDFKADRVSTLASDTSHADFVAIVHPDVVSSQCSVGGNPCSYDADCTAGAADRCEIDAGSALGQLLAHRQAQGLAVRVARLQDVYDEFADGEAGAGALKDFLSWVWNGGWAGSPPSFALLVGDGSFAYKAGTASGSFVPTPLIVKEGNPTLPYYSTDNSLGALAGSDTLPDVLVGRIPARTPTETATVCAKIVDYEQSPPSGSWASTAMVISDRGKAPGPTLPIDVFESTEFERINDIGADMVADTAYTTVKLRYFSDYCGATPASCAPTVIKADIKAMVNAAGKACSLSHVACASGVDCTLPGDTCEPVDGAALIQFQGHGNFDLWSDDKIFCGNNLSGFCTPDNTQELFNGLRLPWLIVNNCLSGGFHSTSAKSFGEQWLKRAGGGAVAVLAPSGLGFRFLGEAVTNAVWGDLFGPEKVREIAEPLFDAYVSLCVQPGTPEGCEFYTLLGDPATRLQLPHVAPPTDVVAVASTGPTPQVSLSWTPSPDAGVGYHVYRATQIDQPYVRVTGSPIVPASYVDTGVVQAQTYYYYVVAVKAGFESAWSNFNSDCAAQNPLDCVRATPLNLVPPTTPGTPVAVDPETGGRLDLSWAASVEPDLYYYELHYGTTPAMTEPTLVAGASTFSLAGLQNGTTYYFAVRAVNTSGTFSALSGTGTGVPTQVLGVKAPGFVSTLRLAKSGDDTLLTWNAVTADIYGKPETVAHYEVHRGLTVDFVPGPATLLGTTVAPTFTDPDSLEPGDPDYHYLVRAIDAEGNPGGLGHNLPDGIRDLALGKGPGSDLILSWTAVTLDFGGEPTTVTRYDVYAAAAPFTRADIRDGNVPLLTSTAGTTVQIAPAAGSWYYSILAVDARGNESPF